ncbi:MAG TPA: hypothetical protein VEJ00_02885 [Candidatus Acidoferrales bacterium]|nr:hypothetical protein [Candidatus Acidoferrales bacterium]
MRALATCIVALGLAASPVLAKAGGTGANGTPSTTEAKSGAAPAQPGNTSLADPKANAAAKAEPSSSELESELQELRDLLESQSRQIQEQQQKMQLLEEQLTAATAAKEAVTADPADPESIGPKVALATKAVNAGAADDKKPETPNTINIKGISLTPIGFMAAETVWRQKALAADVNTPLNSVPFNGSSNGHMSEFQASGRQSRFGMLVEGKLDKVKIGGYYEADFLSAGTTSNNNQSNSYTLRQRQFWGQAAFNSGWTLTGGQQWSLLTETTKGMDNRSEALPQVIDAQYVAGFSWARQFGFRVTKNFNNKVWLGVSVEEPQATLTVHGNPTVSCAPANPFAGTPTTTGTCSASALNGTRVVTNVAAGAVSGNTVLLPNVSNDFLLGAFGASGGLYNPLGNYQYNPSPDFIVKAVFEPGFGHYEIFGVFAQFRDRVFPCAVTSTAAPVPGCGTLPVSGGSVADTWSGAGAFNDSKTGGGVGGNARWALFEKHVDLGVHFLGGTGIGRYGSVGLPDATIRWTTPVNPAVDGTLALLHNYQALGTVQLHPTPKLDINLYVGGEYSARAGYIKSGATPNVGYGAQGFANWGCSAEIQPFAAQSTSASTGVPTSVAGGNGFIPGALQNCTGDTRNLVEGSIQFWYRFYKGPKGTVQYGMQYSSYVRNTWRGVASGTGADGIAYSTNGAPHANENMVFTSFRYVLP